MWVTAKQSLCFQFDLGKTVSKKQYLEMVFLPYINLKKELKLGDIIKAELF